MPYRGSDVLRHLEGGYHQLREGAAQLDARLKQLEADGQANLRRRGDTLVDLARLYLPDLESETVESTFAEVRGQLRELLLAKQQKQGELEREWDAALDTRQQAEERLNGVTERLDALVARREELEQELAKQLTDDNRFQQLSSEALAAEERIEQNFQRVDEIRQEATDKLPAYEQSRLFKYLVKQKFGTPEYTRSGLTGRLDKWVAGLVGFERAKKSYDFLRVTPALMEAEVDRRRADFDALMQRVDAIEEQVSGQIGLTDVLSQGVAAGAERDAVLQELEVVQARQQELGETIRKLDESQGEFHQQAVERMKRFLGTMRVSTLDAHARATADPEDDKLMDEIRWINDQLDEARAESEDLHPQLAAARTRQRELGDLLRRFRRAEYDSHRSMFDARLDMQEQLSLLVAGKQSVEQLWEALCSHQRFEPTWAEREWGERDWPYVDGNPSRGSRGGEFSYVLMHILAEAAGAAIRHAEREARRRSRHDWQAPPSVRRRARGGFTRGNGF